MAKNITIEANWPHSMKFIDHTDNQWVEVVRKDLETDFSDADECTYTSKLIGDEEPIVGKCQWGDVFKSVQTHFGLTSLDGTNDIYTDISKPNPRQADPEVVA